MKRQNRRKMKLDKHATIRIDYAETGGSTSMKVNVGGKWNRDVARFAIESIVREVDKKPQIVRFWELLWRGL